MLRQPADAAMLGQVRLATARWTPLLSTTQCTIELYDKVHNRIAWKTFNCMLLTRAFCVARVRHTATRLLPSAAVTCMAQLRVRACCRVDCLHERDQVRYNAAPLHDVREVPNVFYQEGFGAICWLKREDAASVIQFAAVSPEPIS